jgi:hypothetical protein
MDELFPIWLFILIHPFCPFSNTYFVLIPFPNLSCSLSTMFEPACEFPVKTGAAFLSNNLSIYHHKTKGQTYAAYLGKDAVKMLQN